MFEFVSFFRDMWSQIVTVLDRYSFSIGGLDVSVFDILLGFLLMSMVVSIFWKGARA